MKKIFLASIFSIFCAGAAAASDMLPAGGYYETRAQNCDMRAMRAQLDQATADRRAVITVVKCNGASDAAASENSDTVLRDDNMHAGTCGCTSYGGCGGTIERVVGRRIYVEETVQRYEPVVHYVPAGQYTVRRRVCNNCDM